MTYHWGLGPQLITYVDRLGGTVDGLRRVLQGPLANAFDGVHLLPFYTPFDGADAGFDPQDHTAVDPRLGTWDDVRSLARTHVVMGDVIVNHVSAESAMYRDVLQRGTASPWAPMFLTMESVFPHGAREEDLRCIYRPRPGLPFTATTWGDERRLAWTTFTPGQIDIDLRSEEAWAYLESVLDALTGGGVTMLRLDAVGYTGKEPGTSCFMTDSTRRHTQRIVELARVRGAHVLLEIHGHYTQQVQIAQTVDYVYDFALPPLVLHALHAHDLEPLATWLRVRPSNAVTVLDTHDGIGIIDVGESALAPGQAGLLAPEQIDALVESIHDASAGTSRLATGAAASNLDLYQVNCTFYDALGRDDQRYLLARLIQLMTPGIPQVYYVGLFAGVNDMDLLARSGVGRDVNRHRYSRADVEAALDAPVVREQLAALRLRRRSAAFNGTYSSTFSGTEGVMRWENDGTVVSLAFDVAHATFRLYEMSDAAVTYELTHQDLGSPGERVVRPATSRTRRGRSG